MTERDSVFVDLDGWHPGVVLRVEGADLLVIGGSSQYHPYPAVVVPYPSAKARHLCLSKTTYFYANSVRRVRASEVEPREGRATGKLFIQLLDFSHTHAAELFRSSRL